MNEPTVRLDSLPVSAVALLRAVHDALALPLPGLSDEDECAYAKLLESRAQEARIILACVLNSGHEMGPAAASLREWTAREPVTYTPWTGDGGAA
ncbi:hypothetical protein [Streptomyces sp. NPDC001286]